MNKTLPAWIDQPDPGMPDPVVEYYPDGSVSYVLYHNTQGIRHREGGPAYTQWTRQGIKEMEIWYTQGIVKRDTGKTYISVWDGSGDSIKLGGYEPLPRWLSEFKF